MAVSVREIDSDSSLVAAAQSGDGDAFAELFRRHHPVVLRSCARRLGNRREADEIAQAAFVRAWERIDQCRGERRFGGWVQRIAQRLCVDARRASGRTILTDRPADSALAGPLTAPEEAVLQREAADLMHRALADLPPRQRDVVVARDIEDRRPGDIAAALGVSVGAVDSLLLRGRRRLAASVRGLSEERGAINASSASSVAGIVGGSGSGLAQSIGAVVSRTAYQVAATLGMVPGVPGAADQLAVAAVFAAALAAGPVSGASTPATPLDVPAGVSTSVPALPAASLPAAPAAPATPAPAAPAAPAVPRVAVPPTATEGDPARLIGAAGSSLGAAQDVQILERATKRIHAVFGP